MSDDSDERLPGLTIAEKAEQLGVSYGTCLRIWRTAPALLHWSALWGDGRAKLRAWLDAGEPPVPDVRQLMYVGDLEIRDVVRAVLARLPAPMARYVIESVSIVGSGVSTTGWCSGALPWSIKTDAFVSLATAALDAVAHELAHSWQQLPSSKSMRDRVAAQNNLAALAVDGGDHFVGKLADLRFEREVAADRLAVVWGFRASYTNYDRARAGLRDDVCRRAADAEEPEEPEEKS